jgi:DNA-binding PadR family transcriptional regulator
MRHHFHHHHQDCHEHGPVFAFIGRHRGGRGFGRLRGEFEGDDRHGESFRSGRKLASADLQLLVLALLAEKPRHGYEIIKALDERSKGFYVPSPGMVYPALTYLDEIGHATMDVEGSKKLYRITAEGTAFLDQNRSTVDTILEQLAAAGERMEQVRRAFSDDGSAEDADDRSGGFGFFGFRDVKLAARELRSALHDKKRGLSESERMRIVEILRRAAAEIRGK